MAPEEKTQKKKEDKFIVGEVATATAPVIKDTETDEVFTLELAIAKVLNNQEKLMKLLD